jgi:hypothetical protein
MLAEQGGGDVRGVLAIGPDRLVRANPGSC